MRTATNVTVRVVNYKPSEVASVALSFEGCATLGKSASILTLEGPDGGLKDQNFPGQLHQL